VTTILIPLESIYHYQLSSDLQPTPPAQVGTVIDRLAWIIITITKRYPQLRVRLKIKAGHYSQTVINRLLAGNHQVEVITEPRPIYHYFNQQTLIICLSISGAFHEAIMSQVPFVVIGTDHQYLKNKYHRLLSTLSKNNLTISTRSDLKLFLIN